jgi:cell filamentation protein
MRDKYEYIDRDYTYTDKNTGVLRNLAGISDTKDLLFFESAAVIKRSKYLELNPISIKDSNTLLDIHQYLFQDVYFWAGNCQVDS